MKLRDRVKAILYQYPETRHSDRELAYRIWNEDIGKRSEMTLSPHGHFEANFLYDYADGFYTKADSFKRERQWLQAKYVLLRGHNYHNRQKHSKVYAKAFKESPGY